MRIFYGLEKNIGDVISPFILEYFTDYKAEYVSSIDSNKLLMVGSFLEMVREGDTVLGTGSNKPTIMLDAPRDVNFLSVRGPLTRKLIVNAEVPEIYGDPALLLPLMYFPKVEKRKKTSLIPHYIDKPLFDKNIIDIEQNWKTFVDELLACEEIISSSLHGIVIAEAYGIPATWAIWSNKIMGGDFKYQDYFLGTGRDFQKPNQKIPPISNLKEIQSCLIGILEKL